MTDFAHFDRRAMLVGLATLLGVAALPEKALAVPSRKGRFLPGAQFALLAAVVDTILPTTDTPGALAAKVDVRLDAMLRDWASSATREEIGAALARVDAAARTAKGRTFAALSPQDRAEVLRDHDKAALKAAPAADGSKPKMFDLLATPSDPGYKRLKELVVTLYYYSPVGSANELHYEHVPGAFEPSIKLTPGARPYLGLGPV